MGNIINRNKIIDYCDEEIDIPEINKENIKKTIINGDGRFMIYKYINLHYNGVKLSEKFFNTTYIDWGLGHYILLNIENITEYLTLNYVKLNNLIKIFESGCNKENCSFYKNPKEIEIFNFERNTFISGENHENFQHLKEINSIQKTVIDSLDSLYKKYEKISEKIPEKIPNDILDEKIRETILEKIPEKIRHYTRNFILDFFRIILIYSFDVNTISHIISKNNILLTIKCGNHQYGGKLMVNIKNLLGSIPFIMLRSKMEYDNLIDFMIKDPDLVMKINKKNIIELINKIINFNELVYKIRKSEIDVENKKLLQNTTYLFFNFLPQKYNILEDDDKIENGEKILGLKSLNIILKDNITKMLENFYNKFNTDFELNFNSSSNFKYKYEDEITCELIIKDLELLVLKYLGKLYYLGNLLPEFYRIKLFYLSNIIKYIFAKQTDIQNTIPEKSSHINNRNIISDFDENTLRFIKENILFEEENFIKLDENWLKNINEIINYINPRIPKDYRFGKKKKVSRKSKKNFKKKSKKNLKKSKKNLKKKN